MNAEVKTEDIFKQRGNVHGDIEDNCDMADDLMNVIEHWWNLRKKDKVLPPTVHWCLRYICHKIARFITGDHMHPDHMDDVAGYAKLINRYNKKCLGEADGDGDSF